MGDDKEISDRLVAQLHRARRELEGLMARQGLSPQDGWRIHETLVNTDKGTAFVLRPIHRVRPSPEGLQIHIPIEG